MVRAPMRIAFALSILVLLAGCPGGPVVDAGMVVVDSGIAPPACDSPKACKALGFDGVCRSGKCASQVLCADDVECGLGESCVSGNCAFTGCASDSDCSSHRCRADVFACSECGTSADCPASRPVCDGSNKCVQCGDDSQCVPPGPAHCDAQAGGCVHCLEDKHCPNGLKCGASHLCTGAPAGANCPMGTLCGSGLVCVGLGGNNVCLPSCKLAAPTCATGQICFKLTYSLGLVFDEGGLLGVCYASQPGLKGYREACSRTQTTGSTSNCEPNLQCIPDSANLSLCRTFCDLNTSGACPTSEKCHPFRGDINGRLYGVCYPDNGWGDACAKDSACKSSQACTPYEDPSADYQLANVCQYGVGAAPGLSPCKDTALVDGGVIKADKLCQSGSCQGDPLAPTRKFFCYGACKTDPDCNYGGRSGSCDGQFDFPVGMDTGAVKGCRPTCASTAACGVYGAGIVCRSRFLAGYSSSFHASCAPPAGTLPPGSACSQSPQCRSGFCLFDDGRGVRRSGVCADACETAADCQVDGGTSRTGPLDCTRQTFMGYQGADGVHNTYDDRLHTAQLCGGSACSVDSDCGAAVCVPDADPADAGNQLVLRCRPQQAVGVLSGGASCSQDSDCSSGVCGTLQAPSTGTGKACFQACNGSTACPGTSVCRVGGMRVDSHSAQLTFDSCAP